MNNSTDKIDDTGGVGFVFSALGEKHETLACLGGPCSIWKGMFGFVSAKIAV